MPYKRYARTFTMEKTKEKVKINELSSIHIIHFKRNLIYLE